MNYRERITTHEHKLDYKSIMTEKKTTTTILFTFRTFSHSKLRDVYSLNSIFNDLGPKIKD